MKKVLYIASTINGFIAKKDNSTAWSDAEWEEYKSRINNAGGLIIGKKTYDIMLADNVFPDLVASVGVLSHSNVSGENISSFESAQDAIAFFENKGLETVYIAGGAQIDALFLKEGLIDEIILDIEPLIYGEGIPILSPFEYVGKLQFLNFKKLADNSLQLHYALKK